MWLPANSMIILFVLMENEGVVLLSKHFKDETKIHNKVLHLVITIKSTRNEQILLKKEPTACICLYNIQSANNTHTSTSSQKQNTMEEGQQNKIPDQVVVFPAGMPHPR